MRFAISTTKAQASKMVPYVEKKTSRTSKLEHLAFAQLLSSPLPEFRSRYSRHVWKPLSCFEWRYIRDKRRSKTTFYYATGLKLILEYSDHFARIIGSFA